MDSRSGGGRGVGWWEGITQCEVVDLHMVTGKENYYAFPALEGIKH